MGDNAGGGRGGRGGGVVGYLFDHRENWENGKVGILSSLADTTVYPIDHISLMASVDLRP